MAELIHAITHVHEWPSNFYYNVTTSIKMMTSTSLARVILIVGIYVLIRPYIVKFFAWTHFKTSEGKEVLNAGLAKSPDEWGEGLVSANDLRSRKGGFDSQTVRKRVAGREEELRGKIERGEIRQDEMFDLLVDYEEGKEGW